MSEPDYRAMLDEMEKSAEGFVKALTSYLTADPQGQEKIRGAAAAYYSARDSFLASARSHMINGSSSEVKEAMSRVLILNSMVASSLERYGLG